MYSIFWKFEYVIKLTNVRESNQTNSMGTRCPLFLMSAFMKTTMNDTALVQASSFGIDARIYRLIGILETVSLVLFLIPRTWGVGTLLLAAYMGGAIVTHLQHQQPIMMAVTVQILLWITAFLRFLELKMRLLTKNI